MTALLYATVYAPDNLPTEVAHIASKSLGTVNEASDLEYKKHLRGSGALKISINRHHAQAALLVQDRYLIVHGANGPVGGGFLDEATVDLSHTDGPGAEFLIWTGMGQMGILRNGRMDATSNIAGGHAPIDGYWALDNQGNMAGASNGHAIPMLKRALVEMQLNSPPGISVVDHSSWTYDLDTDSVAVPFIPGEVQGANVGDDALSLLAQMSQLGDAIFVMDHLFKLDAHLTYGTDKSGAFGAGTVRFEKSINVAAAIQRKVRGAVNRTHLIVGGAERTFITAVDPAYVSGDVVRWGFLSVPETADPDGLEAAGLAHLAARKRQTDTFTFPQHDHGDAPANGIYEPGDHYDVGDTVSHHTGSGDYDANEQASPVAAISWVLKTGDEANGDYEVTPEIGSTFHWDGEEAFTGSTPGSQHRILLCPFDAGVIEMDTSWKVLNVKGVAPPTGWNRVGFDDAAWASAAIMTGGAYVMSMGHLASDALTPSDEIVLRKEFYIEPEDLGGAAVTFKYALDNAGKIYVNGTQIVSLGPDFTNTAGHYTSDHATTLARSTFRAGFNVVAIYVNNDAAGSVGATPPGAMSAGIYININTTNGNGTSKYAQRCDRHYHASDIDENNYGNVQAAIDALLTGAGGLPWFNVVSYGAVGDGTTDDFAAINLAIAAYNAAGGGVLYFPATADDYLVSAGLTTLTAPGIVRGDGASSLITCSSATAHLFTSSAGPIGVSFRDLRMENTHGTPTAGSAIRVSSGGNSATYHNLRIDDFWVGIRHEDGASWAMDHLRMNGIRKYGIHISNATADEGDWSIDNSVIAASTHSPDAAIRIDSSGGGKISNLKVNGSDPATGYDYGIDVVFASVQSSVLTVVGSSIENVSADAIRVTTTGTGRYGAIALSGIQVGLHGNNTGYVVKLDAASPGGYSASGGIGIVTIDGIVAYTDGTARAAIGLTNTDRVTIGDLALEGFSARYTQTGATNITDAGAGTLDSLTDVTITGAATGDMLRYNGTAWVDTPGRWEVVTNGVDILVWDGANLLHEWTET